MNRKEMLGILHEIEQPIFAYACYHDMGCEFQILTGEKGIEGMGANWPVIGPLRLTKAQHHALREVFAKEPKAGGEEELAELIEQSRLPQAMKEKLLELAGRIEDAGSSGQMAVFRTVARSKRPPGRAFFAYKDDRDDGRPILFATLAEAAVHFATTAAKEDGKAWESMTLRAWGSGGISTLLQDQGAILIPLCST